MKLKYTIDDDGKEILIDENEEHQVMMQWEKPYMEKCIELLNPFGKVLEIGFGMGYSASKICSFTDVTEYNIIECSPVVWEKVEEFKKKHSDLSCNLIKGRWQDVLHTCGEYDCIFFDDYISSSFKENDQRFEKFLCEILLKHSHVGTRIGLYSTTNYTEKKCIECIDIHVTKYPIDIPKSCKYINGDIMFIPIITKKTDCNENIREQIIKTGVDVIYRIPEENRDLGYKLHKLKREQSKTSQNLIIVDNFIRNAYDIRQYVLKCTFTNIYSIPCRYCHIFTDPIILLHIRNLMNNIGEDIVEWIEANQNGSFCMMNSHDKQLIEYKTNCDWIGVLFLCDLPPNNAGLGIYKFIDDTTTVEEMTIKNIEDSIRVLKYDFTKWNQLDFIHNKFNRLVLFRANQFYSLTNPFGVSNMDSNLFQLFSFTTKPLTHTPQM